jgi:gamma-glutamylcysteine synthetase
MLKREYGVGLYMISAICFNFIIPAALVDVLLAS